MIIVPIASWTDFESLVSSKKLLMQYSEDPAGYEIYAPEGEIFVWNIHLLKGTSDGDDFEDNHKATSNKPLFVRGGADRPMRVSASPQPDGTVEHWKGYEISCGSGDSSKTIDVTFASKVYLRGGTMYSAEVVAGDKFKAEVQADVGGGTWVTVLTPMEDIFLLANIPTVVTSPECMEMPTTTRLRVTFTPSSTGVAKKVYFFVNYFK